ncbi:hexokinase type 2-like isoform X2 [Artemia franciscana]|uniref:hexokinase type 2-like isoform X2 n=1 Tax=Artemia franciscana TaxID=6661 RepID=UPI0032D9E85A
MMEKKCAKLILTNKNIKRVSGIMLEEIEMGLRQKSNKNADIKCYPTYVRNLPNGKEKGKFLALDLGGTNFRVLLIQLGETAPEKEFVSREFPLPDLIRTSSGEALFDHIAECLALFVKEFKVDKEIIPLGFTFSFPCRQEGLTKAKLVQWTKGFTCSEVEGRDVAELLQNAIHKRKDVHIKIMAVLNDTTGTLMSSAYKQPNCKIGLIIGTGTNACYVEKIENMELLDGDSDDSNQCIVNTEWGAFGDNGSLDFIRTDFDRALDSVTSNRGKQLYEKMISGKYLGEIVRRVLVSLAKDGLIFKDSSYKCLLEADKFKTKLISEIEKKPENDFTDCECILEELGLTDFTHEDCAKVRYVCQLVSRRAAFMAAAGVATLINKINEKHVVVAVDGTVYRLHPHFRHLMEQKIKQLIRPGLSFELILSEDGSGRGAALVAAVADRMKREEIYRNLLKKVFL